jgi:hypothetical protein
MKPVKSQLFSAIVAACLLLAPALRAEATSRSSEAQKAYAEVDYERTRALAAAAIRHGGNARAATAELYLLWATAAAALDQTDEARTAFSFALAANPELKLDRTLSPKIRAPYLEARGSLSGADGKPPLEVTLRRRKQEVELGLTDALQVATTLVVATRGSEPGAFTERRFAAAPTRRLPVSNGSDLQFFVRVLDRYGNVLFELGTEDEPQRLLSVTSSKPGSPPRERGNSANPLPYYVTSGALAALGVAAGGVATAMYLRREDAANEWNGSGCERPGMTRIEQCREVDDRRKSAEHLAIGFTATGGALLVGSIVSLLLSPATSHANVALDAGPNNVVLRLRTTL